MTTRDEGPRSGRPHWLAAIAILVLVMLVVPVIARFY
ncbi:hypothetical protein FHS91_003258 [Sphingobium xanthum]